MGEGNCVVDSNMVLDKALASSGIQMLDAVCE